MTPTSVGYLGKVAHSTRHSSEHGDQLNLDQRIFR
jgi:hypothetical protein